MMDPRTQRPLNAKINLTGTQAITERSRNVDKAHRVKHRMSIENKLEIEVGVPTHLGYESELVGSGIINTYDADNVNGTTFVLNVNNRRTVRSFWTDYVKHADVFSGGEEFSIFFLNTGRKYSVKAPLSSSLEKKIETTRLVLIPMISKAKHIPVDKRVAWTGS